MYSNISISTIVIIVLVCMTNNANAGTEKLSKGKQSKNSTPKDIPLTKFFDTSMQDDSTAKLDKIFQQYDALQLSATTLKNIKPIADESMWHNLTEIVNNVQANEIITEFLNKEVGKYCHTVFDFNYTNGSHKVVFTIRDTSTQDTFVHEQILTDTRYPIDQFVEVIKTANRDNFLNQIQELLPSINTDDKINDATPPVADGGVGGNLIYFDATAPVVSGGVVGGSLIYSAARNYGMQNEDDNFIDGTQWSHCTQCDEKHQSASSLQFENSELKNDASHAHENDASDANENVLRMYPMIEELTNDITHSTSTRHVENDQLNLTLSERLNEQVKDSFETMMENNLSLMEQNTRLMIDQSQMKNTQLELETQLHDLQIETNKTIQQLKRNLTHTVTNLTLQIKSSQNETKHIQTILNQCKTKSTEKDAKIANLTHQVSHVQSNLSIQINNATLTHQQLIHLNIQHIKLKNEKEEIHHNNRILTSSLFGGVVMFIVFCITATSKIRKWNKQNVDDVRTFFKKNIEILQKTKNKQLKNINNNGVKHSIGKIQHGQLAASEIDEFLAQLNNEVVGGEIGDNMTDEELEARLRKHFNHKLS